MPTTGTVDERVVEMRIDHEKFESGAKKTISILESLDKGLKSLGDQHTDGFDNIGGALDKVTNKISFFGTVGDQVIRNLTSKAMELAGQLGNAVSSLTTVYTILVFNLASISFCFTPLKNKFKILYLISEFFILFCKLEMVSVVFSIY